MITAFLFCQASSVIIGIIVVFILLSYMMLRSYCHFFVCPTGNLFRILQNLK